MSEPRRRWRAYDPETGTLEAIGVEPDEPPARTRVVYDEPDPRPDPEPDS